MTILQRHLYNFFKQDKTIKILIVKNYIGGLKAKDVFDYFQIKNRVLAEFKPEEFDDLTSYETELFSILNSFDEYFFSKKQPSLIIPESCLNFRFPNKKLREHFKIEFADILKIEIIQDLCYRKTPVVQNQGEYFFKNGILDIFPINSSEPFRIKLTSDDEVSEIYRFSQFTQRTFGEELEEINIAPALFKLPKTRINEINSDIQYSYFNSLVQNLRAYGFWFLKKDETFSIFDLGEVVFADKFIQNQPPISEVIDIKFETQKNKFQHTKNKIIINELLKGDFVVHQKYGIGIFEGISKENFFGSIRDFVKIRYAGDGEYLLLPIEKLHLIDRYISATGKTPKLDRMGKGGFASRSKKVREKIKTVAEYIAKLSAQKKLIQAPKIEKKDLTPIQKTANFEYTPDQKIAIQEIENEITKKYPMEHLLIGDVGFGKTEVALNIIYLVVQNGFQVAFVVPTSLLAKQHYENLKPRLEILGIKTAQVDRFTKPKRQEIENGEIQFLIGTHSVFNYEFKNLAFLIIDEEHKFGVKQKNMLQMKYPNIHQLSMSATPIPRTLQQTISNLKTVSKLETPPLERIPVKTFVKEYDELIIKQGILRELRRNGQIYFLFNSIANIENYKNILLNIVPNLRILILHSKISPKKMEEEITKFANGDYDLLLSTTIIGAGIHIPNVNTIFINDADRFGIADLHQLRGRVGRGNREAYCYFLVEDFELLTKNAKKRLSALEENSELGSGSTLAMHDLEIRGGGTIYGENQSGQIDDIGLSLYLKILEDEIQKLTIQGAENLKSNFKDIDIRLTVQTYFSDEVIPNEQAKLELYRRITESKNIQEIDEIKNEILDRFGQLDYFAENFFLLVKIRILAEKKGIISISNFEKNISLLFVNDKTISLKSPTKDDDDILLTIFNYLKNL